MPDPTTLDTFLRAYADTLRAGDTAPGSLAGWTARKEKLRAAMFAAMGTGPAKPCELAPRIVGVLKRPTYRIEKLLFQTRPDVWVSASLYIPEKLAGKAPAVLAVHGHWAGARRDPVVQARCLGLVHLGFVVLCVDAFSAGERHPIVQRGTYHGALLGSTLWPAGQSLLGVQVYDNHRAVDYLLTRPEVDGTKLGITGASGGGNQSMYAGALDERFQAVVPVCSVGQYRAYLQAACCVCEVLPSALRITEEGDVLGLVAPRALMVISATRDAFQFSVGEAKKSLARAADLFRLHRADDRLRHAVFESGHDYSKPMREAMYGWMTRWLKGEGTGAPIPEPAHTVETPEDLACFPGGKRPASFLFPPDLARREGERLLAWHTEGTLDHREAWEGRAVVIRSRLTEALGGLPREIPVKVTGKGPEYTLTVEPGLEIDVSERDGGPTTALVVHLDGREKALAHPLTRALLGKKWTVIAPDLRGTGASQPKGDAIGGAPDHNSAEHALWVGRPLLGQWVADLRAVLQHASRPGRRLTLIGLGQGGQVAIVAGALLGDRLAGVVAVDAPSTWLTTQAYPAGTRMGLLVPGILRAGDVPHLAAAIAPRRLIIAGGFGPSGAALDLPGLEKAYAFSQRIYHLLGLKESLQLRASAGAVADLL
ncbi:MAG: alpha/beta hydrolase [Gemmataceae bacterium]